MNWVTVEGANDEFIMSELRVHGTKYKRIVILVKTQRKIIAQGETRSLCLMEFARLLNEMEYDEFKDFIEV